MSWNGQNDFKLWLYAQRGTYFWIGNILFVALAVLWTNKGKIKLRHFVVIFTLTSISNHNTCILYVVSSAWVYKKLMLFSLNHPLKSNQPFSCCLMWYTVKCTLLVCFLHSIWVNLQSETVIFHQKRIVVKFSPICSSHVNYLGWKSPAFWKIHMYDLIQ